MELFWTASIIALFISNLVFLVLLLALTRQLGIVLVRLGPTVARETADGLAIGAQLAPAVLQDVRGRRHDIAPVKSGSTLMLFLAPGCQACGELVQGLRTFAVQYARDIRTLAISTAEPSARDESYATRLEPAIPYIRDRAFADKLLVRAIPFALLLDASNTLVSKGIVNSLEQLESLVAVESTQSREAPQRSSGLAEEAVGGGE